MENFTENFQCFVWPNNILGTFFRTFQILLRFMTLGLIKHPDYSVTDTINYNKNDLITVKLLYHRKKHNSSYLEQYLQVDVYRMVENKLWVNFLAETLVAAV